MGRPPLVAQSPGAGRSRLPVAGGESGARPAPSEEATLLARVRTLELLARRNAAGMQSGELLTAIRGRGLVFHEARKYVAGEPARSIDWNVTARLGEPYVKVHLEERQRDVVVALDVSPSMHAGFQERTKLEHAVELAATLAFSAVAAGDRIGLLLFADRVLDRRRPRGGRRQLFRVLRALLSHVEPWQRPVRLSDPRAAIHALGELPGRLVVFLISDFIDHDVPEDLKYLQARHDVSLLHVYDPLEYAAGPVVLPGFSPEGSVRPSPVQPGETGSFEQMQELLRVAAATHHMAVGSASTVTPVRHALGKLFHLKRRLLWR